MLLVSKGITIGSIDLSVQELPTFRCNYYIWELSLIKWSTLIPQVARNAADLYHMVARGLSEAKPLWRPEEGGDGGGGGGTEGRGEGETEGGGGGREGGREGEGLPGSLSHGEGLHRAKVYAEGLQEGEGLSGG